VGLRTFLDHFLRISASSVRFDTASADVLFPQPLAKGAKEFKLEWNKLDPNARDCELFTQQSLSAAPTSAYKFVGVTQHELSRWIGEFSHPVSRCQHLFQRLPGLHDV
jgi:hypothetical protein